MALLKLLEEAENNGTPMYVLMTNGHRVTGIVTGKPTPGPWPTVQVSTSYEYLDEDSKRAQRTGVGGWVVNEDKPPTHVLVDHISLFAYEED